MTYKLNKTRIDLRLERHLRKSDAQVETQQSIFQYLAAQEVATVIESGGRSRSNGQSQWQSLKAQRHTQARDIASKKPVTSVQPNQSKASNGRLKAFVGLTRLETAPGGLRSGAWRVFRRQLD